ncbi:MAG: sigma-70 family RNA polymerase sigma factor, partial [Pseudomonadota bacterium]|nr:sigma-70 family RNA polymerase sigma factor [Pseudomonadota bacterium]
NWRVAKIATTKAQRKLFFNLRSSKKRLGWLNQKEINEVAEDLGVKPSDVVEMEKRMSNYDATLEPRLDDDESCNMPINYLENNEAGPEELLENEQNISNQQETLKNAVSLLDDRSRNIISNRWLAEKKVTLHELAAIHNISAERVRQIENTAIKKLKESIKN